jgi:hypothetical protein
MTETPIAIAIVASVVVLAAVSVVFGLGLPKTYRERKCAGKEWRRQFPISAKEDIRHFLSLFVRAFGFRDKDKLKFRPNDKLLDIYRKRYPIREMPDALELETFSDSVKTAYGIELEKLWSSELTLGGLFLQATKAQPGVQPDAV